jgi:SNF2 family DNA or RNA helicase
MSTQRTFSLSKNKESEKQKNQTDFYSFEAQLAKFRFQAESRIWKIFFDSELPGLACVENSQQETEVVLYDKRCLQCSCEEFLNQELNSCLHIEALKRLWRETKQEDLNWIKNVFGHSQVNFLCYDTVKHCFFHSFKSSPEFIASCRKIGLCPEKEILVLTDLKKLLCTIDKLEVQISPIFRHLILQLKAGINKPSPVIPSREAIKSLIDNKLSLYEYQYEAIQFLGQAERAILALPMGYGKTLVSILASHLLGLKRILVISPATIKNYWQTEYEKFTGRKFDVWDAKKDINDCSNNVILSYELLQRNIDSIPKNWDLVIVDEVQRIRNDESKIWAAVNKLSSRYAFALSGTVIENGIQDLLSIVRWLYPKYFSPEWKFYSRFCDTEGPKVLGLRNSEDLQQLLSTFLFRAPETLSDVKLPNIKHQVIQFKLNIEQANYHDDYYQQAKILLSKSFEKQLTFGERTKLNALLLKARQACNSAKLIFPESKEVGQKYPEVFKLIQKIIERQEKIVVYSEWIESLMLLEEFLIKEKIDYLKLIGKVKSNKRLKLVADFISNSQKKLFISTDAGGYGLDGLQLAANNVIHLELPWNPGKLDQRNGRLQRLLQKAPEVRAYYFVAQDSIEELVQKSNERKRKIRFQVLGELK